MYSSPKNLYGFLYICNPKEDMVNNISTVLVHYNEIHLSIYWQKKKNNNNETFLSNYVILC